MISVIIPTLDEAAHLPATLARLRRQNEAHEVIVVDGGSADDTTTLARQVGATVIESPIRQRAFQMNLGASSARGETLLFLHADTSLPPDALVKVRTALEDPAVVGGGFARRYDRRSPFLRGTCLLAELRTRLFGWFLGDQAIFVRSEIFAALGGYRALDVFEDLDFSRRLAQTGRVKTLRPPVVSAARRFSARGAALTTGRDLVLTICYLGREYCCPSPPPIQTASQPR